MDNSAQTQAQQSQLEFIGTKGVKAFLKSEEATTLDILPPKEDGQKPFFVTDSGIIGTVSDNADLQNLAGCAVSKVQTPEGDTFWMLHKQPTRDNAIASISL